MHILNLHVSPKRYICDPKTHRKLKVTILEVVMKDINNPLSSHKVTNSLYSVEPTLA